MGRSQEKDRKRKKAATTCQRLDGYLVAKKARDQIVTSEHRESVAEGEQLTLGSSSTATYVEPLPHPCWTVQVQDNVRVLTAGVAGGNHQCHHDNASYHNLVVDLGNLYSKAKSPLESIQALTAAEKYNLLKNHTTPRDDQVFPPTSIGGRNRAFRPVWLSEHPWMVYSEQVDGVFCIACGIFCAQVSKGYFVCKPFRAWNKIGEKTKEHQQCGYHHQAIEQADNFMRTVEKPDTAITAQSDTRRAANVTRNRAVLKSIAAAVLYCGRQCIALRGDGESMESPGNPGNFLSLLRLLAVHDEELRRHLEIPAMRCATYLSPQTQNELIKVMGKHIILQEIIDDLTAAPFYSILADEVTSHNVEHLAICARFVDRSTKEVREEFLTFMKLDRITGERIADSIFSFLEENNIPLANMRGQGYDGASNMSSDRVDVQARIRQKAPLATYVHCSGHCLNLVISKSCALPEVRNVIDSLKHCCRFFLYSPKRSGVQEMIVNHNVGNAERRKPLQDAMG